MDSSTITMTTGKFNGIAALANVRGVIAALAMDQHGSLEKTTGRAVAAAELQSYQRACVEVCFNSTRKGSPSSPF